MANAGWYPDPSGQPGSFRYWDGVSWSAETAGSPYGPPPGGAGAPPPPPSTPPAHDEVTRIPGAPQPPSAPPSAPPSVQQGGYAPYGQQSPQQGGWGGVPTPSASPSWQPGGAPSSGSGGRGSTGRTVGLVLGAIVLVLALGVGSFFVVRAFTGDDGDTTADDDSSQSSDPTASDPTASDPTASDPTESDGIDTGLPADPDGPACAGGAPTENTVIPTPTSFTGGGLSLPPVRGYTYDGAGGPQNAAFTFADGVAAVARVIQKDTWIANYALGSLAKDRGFSSPEQAARTVLSCMEQSPVFYSAFASETELSAEATTVSGDDAFELTAEVRIDDPAVRVDGDVAKIVVVDIGDPDTYGLFVSVVPIGDQKKIDQQDAVADQLTVQ